MAIEEKVASATFEEQTVQTQSVKCENCGGNLIYNPELGKLFCSHCDSTVDVQSFQAKEQDIFSAFEKEEERWDKDNVELLQCENCGAKTVFNWSESAKTCPFCGTAHVKKSDELVGLKPNAVLPFEINLEKAVENSVVWAKRKFFAPRKFKKNINTEHVKGLYVPTFTFDSNTNSIYDGRIGDVRTRRVGSGKNARTETYVVWRYISGTFGYRFNDLLVTAGSKFDQKNIDKIAPFDTDNSKAYNEEFLLGYGAYHYDYGVKDCWGRAKDIMDTRLKKAILSQYSYDRVSYLNVSTKHDGVSYKYVMLPVYVGNYKYNKKVYNFYVNGETGKVGGKTPLSALKILLTVLLGVAVVAGLLCLKFFSGQ